MAGGGRRRGQRDRLTLHPVSEKLDDKTLELNPQVDVDGRDPVDVALDWPEHQGFLTS
ncbi:MAG: hypothetical protein WBQ50_17320 [Nocardioides sp.]